MLFQHHPDGIITVISGSKNYTDSLANFLLDYGKKYSLPQNAILRFYEKGVQHYSSNGKNQEFMPHEWVEGNDIINGIDTLLLNKEKRITPPLIVPSKEELISALEQEYEPQFSDLRVAWANALMRGDTEGANARVTDRKALEQEYNQRMEMIMNG